MEEQGVGSQSEGVQGLSRVRAHGHARWVAVPLRYTRGGARTVKPLTHSAFCWLNFGW